MADSQVDQDAQQSTGGLFSSGFSKIGAAMPSFSAPWNKTDDAAAASASETSTAQPIGEEEQNQKGGFLSGVSGGFSKLTGGLPTVSAPSFGLPWGKKEGDQPGETEVPLAPEEPSGENKADFLSGVSGGFSKLTGGLPSVSVPSFGLPWGKKEGEAGPAAPETDAAVPSESQQTNGILSGVSGGFSKLTGGLPSVSVPSFGLPWGKKEGDGAEQDPSQADQAQGQGSNSSKLSSAVTGIFGVFKPSEDASKLAEDTTPK